MSFLKKLVIFLTILVLAFPAATFGYVYFKLNKMKSSNVDQSILSGSDYKTEKGINNILLMGTDGRPDDSASRSDAMMILTVDNKNKSLKLTSLARDTYVDIPGHGRQKLTHAYVYGQESLLIQTIEQNFELDIQHYAAVDFYSFMDIVDTLGGVEVEVRQGEINEMNKYINETYAWNDNPNKGPLQYVNSPGVQKLNGYQLLSYSRIRKNDSAAERDRRQRNVIQGLMNGFKDLPLTRYPALIDTILPYVITDMSPTKIMSLGATVLGIGNLDIKQMEFPKNDGIRGIGGILSSSTGWVLQFTDIALDELHDFIFLDIIPENQ